MANLLYDSILERKKEKFLSRRDLAELAGVSVVTIQKIERGDDVSLASLRDVCFAMDLIITTVDRSVVAETELKEKEAEISKIKKKLEELECEKEALEKLIKK